jgi:hypothetical protein
MIRQTLKAVVGMFLGGAAGWYVPSILINPKPFGFITIFALRTFLAPIGVSLGLLVGLYCGKKPSPSEPAENEKLSRPSRSDGEERE